MSTMTVQAAPPDYATALASLLLTAWVPAVAIPARPGGPGGSFALDGPQQPAPSAVIGTRFGKVGHVLAQYPGWRWVDADQVQFLEVDRCLPVDAGVGCPGRDLSGVRVDQPLALVVGLVGQRAGDLLQIDAAQLKHHVRIDFSARQYLRHEQAASGRSGGLIDWRSNGKLATLIAMSVTEQMSLADVKNRLSEVVDRLEREHGRVVITKHGHPAAVVISVDDLESLEETLDIMDNAALLGDIRESLSELADTQAAVLSKDEALGLISRQ
jgi:antitoxin YefM